MCGQYYNSLMRRQQAKVLNSNNDVLKKKNPKILLPVIDTAVPILFLNIIKNMNYDAFI